MDQIHKAENDNKLLLACEKGQASEVEQLLLVQGIECIYFNLF
jgi:hypothetical protein